MPCAWRKSQGTQVNCAAAVVIALTPCSISPIASGFSGPIALYVPNSRASADWDLIARFPMRYGAMTPRRDIAVTDSMAITLGGTTVHAWLTPGHTPGTLSFTFPVRDRATPLLAVYAGGTGMNFPNNTPEVGIPAYRTYAQSQQRVAEIAGRAGATVLLANHPWADNALIRMQLLTARGTGKNPFDIGADGVQRFFRVVVGCARVAQLRLEQRQLEGAGGRSAPPPLLR